MLWCLQSRTHSNRCVHSTLLQSAIKANRFSCPHVLRLATSFQDALCIAMSTQVLMSHNMGGWGWQILRATVTLQDNVLGIRE